MKSIAHHAQVFASLLLLIIFAVGCASNKVDWNSRIGTYTYDQAVIDMGPPDRYAKLEDNTKVVDWLYVRGRYVAYGNGAYPYGTGPAYQNYGTFRTADYYTRLTFGPDGKLKSWKRITQ